ncbi:DUF5316 domain-containing protein [Cytobacillus oceanisediminis]|uniref:DUF5316 domain-containing protein n=1 Tax=Bacillaceae TaxID=186817 RepID=UPI0003329378|nr:MULTISPECIES: DUF5316 domain-containing protein [Bacillaceae]EOR25724.1 hypothetical protein A499_04396 [Niallia nealsonii AAU1]MBZ9533749.1 DUF5316 domain-containing protein [Cytobacillus oceanisediminis]MDU1844711.1 DUF5316 domain-containing protein [Niallia nealsonii]MED3793972.1 DUF5316 domain-containing protein [Niallia alba]
MKKKVFISGIFTSVIFIFMSFFESLYNISASIAGTIGLICIIISGLASGAFASGDRIRANYWSQNQKSRTEQVNLSTYFFLFGLPNLIVGITLFTL